MLDAWGDHPAVVETLREASAALDEDLGELIRTGPKEALSLTTNTQPVMLVAGLAAWRAWLAEGGATPDVVAGHSLGEYSALVAAGVLTLAQAAPLVRFRAQAMQQAVPVGAGAMAAVLGMAADQVIAGCAEVTAGFGAGSGECVEAVNFNDPMQTVIAGSKAAVDKACEVLKASGAKRALPLPVSAPFHSSLMRPAAEAGVGRVRGAPHSGAEQHRRRGGDRAGAHPRRAGAPGRRSGALGRGRASLESARRRHHRRVRAGSRAVRYGQAHRA
jgi:[acyl-carrier-protein] S-malonyltransferase